MMKFIEAKMTQRKGFPTQLGKQGKGLCSDLEASTSLHLGQFVIHFFKCIWLCNKVNYQFCYKYDSAKYQDLLILYYLCRRETDIDLSNQLIMCQSQSDVAPFNCESTRRPIPDISHAIHGLKCIIFRAANECEIMGTSFGECSICLEKFLEGDELAQLNCKHAFHSRCLTWWVPAHSNCPYCRTPVA